MLTAVGSGFRFCFDIQGVLDTVSRLKSLGIPPGSGANVSLSLLWLQSNVGLLKKNGGLVVT